MFDVGFIEHYCILVEATAASNGIHPFYYTFLILFFEQFLEYLRGNSNTGAFFK